MAIIGNQKAIKLLDRIIETGKIANAYLFLGPERVGKFTAALEFAKKLTHAPAQGAVRGKQVINPDLIIIEPEIEEKRGVKKRLDIKIETIRELQHKLSLTSTGGKYKVVIVNDSEKLNKTAQNALLKTLEEPNEKIVLLLVAQDEKKLLPTIISRCQKIKFNLATPAELEKNIPAGIEDREDIIFWSLGRPGTALDLINDPEELGFVQDAAREFSGLFSKNTTEKFSLAEELSKDIGILERKLDLWTIMLREPLLWGGAKIKVSPGKALVLMAGIFSVRQILSETNSNPKLALENLFLQIHPVK